MIVLTGFFADDENRKGSRADMGGNDWAQRHDKDLINGRIFQEAFLEGLGPIQVSRVGHDSGGMGQVLAGQL